MKLQFYGGGGGVGGQSRLECIVGGEGVGQVTREKSNKD